MLELIKKHYEKICIAIVYTILAILVYGIWSYSAWNLWYVTLLIVVAIFIVGGVISYFWIKSEKKNEEIPPKTNVQ